MLFMIEGKVIFMSQREVVTLYYLAKGMNAKEIGSILNVSSRTIEAYLDKIKVKLGAYSSF